MRGKMLPLSKAKKLVEAYRKKYPEIAEAWGNFVLKEAKPKKLTPSQRKLEHMMDEARIGGVIATQEKFFPRIKELHQKLAAEEKMHNAAFQNEREWFCRMIFELGRTEARKRTDADQFGTVTGTMEMRDKKEWFADYASEAKKWAGGGNA